MTLPLACLPCTKVTDLPSKDGDQRGGPLAEAQAGGAAPREVQGGGSRGIMNCLRGEGHQQGNPWVETDENQKNRIHNYLF